ncbi:hypothetical protein EVAR_25562_1 [Eumeta japonica]|uniref:Uncharacterized protein n=1 Tax=Eumeta variegata TaxID=151549 RepID=A0A4C1Z7Q1_EUMVA|nr:hypothetical protein EVAR_25562_1 [Eumeta japonica]
MPADEPEFFCTNLEQLVSQFSVAVQCLSWAPIYSENANSLRAVSSRCSISVNPSINIHHNRSGEADLRVSGGVCCMLMHVAGKRLIVSSCPSFVRPYVTEHSLLYFLSILEGQTNTLTTGEQVVTAAYGHPLPRRSHRCLVSRLLKSGIFDRGSSIVVKGTGSPELPLTRRIASGSCYFTCVSRERWCLTSLLCAAQQQPGLTTSTMKLYCSHFIYFSIY